MPADYLDNIIKFYWNMELLDPLLDNYEIFWRSMLSQQVWKSSSKEIWNWLQAADTYAECGDGKHYSSAD